MKYSLVCLFVFVLIAVLLSGCGPADSSSTNFRCFQHGVAIVDVTTLSGAKLGFSGGWVWDDKDGHHSLSNSDSLSCMQSEIKK